jgi:hypothetical protein
VVTTAFVPGWLRRPKGDDGEAQWQRGHSADDDAAFEAFVAARSTDLLRHHVDGSGGRRADGATLRFFDDTGALVATAPITGPVGR